MDVKDVTEVLVAGGLIAKAYPDLLRPSAKAIGSVLGRVVHSAMDEGPRWLFGRLAALLRDVPPERIGAPEPRVAVPALLGLSYSMEQETLREMYAKLLATSMDSLTARDVHPSFAEVIKQLTPDEARILDVLKGDDVLFYDLYSASPGLKGFATEKIGLTDLFERARCEDRGRSDVAISNLQRLELAIFEDHIESSAATFPPWEDALNNLPLLRPHFDRVRQAGQRPKVSARVFRLTAYGRSFCRCCIEALGPLPRDQSPDRTT